MSVPLLDVNVLIALIDPAHPNHDNAHLWFAAHKRGWATCPTTINGCIRILSNPAYPAMDSTPARMIDLMRKMCSSAGHRFWHESVWLLDEQVFRQQAITNYRQITDVYLLGLAVHHRGTLATFDRSIPWKAVVGARANHIDLIGGSR